MRNTSQELPICSRRRTGRECWAGLAFRLNEDNYRKTAELLHDKLQPAGYQNKGVTYANLDAGWSAIPEERMVSMVGELHKKGQKAGIYDAPFAFFGEDTEEEILGAPRHVYEEILLKDAAGKPLPRVDGAIPFDVTHPVWQQQMLDSAEGRQTNTNKKGTSSILKRL